jgi:hypothetical protein
VRLVHAHHDRFEDLQIRDGVAVYLGVAPGSRHGFDIMVLPLEEGATPRHVGTMMGFQEEGFHVGERELYWVTKSMFGVNLHRTAWR